MFDYFRISIYILDWSYSRAIPSRFVTFLPSKLESEGLVNRSYSWACPLYFVTLRPSRLGSGGLVDCLDG